ncbi:uncharacterized protein [Temnothorax longispinosus]|uniref:uncharacterized protein isoform X2 n=2 Tax=Temnothorax longispinosus TaxID=300112 RepID=UPI003A9A13C7
MERNIPIIPIVIASMDVFDIPSLFEDDEDDVIYNACIKSVIEKGKTKRENIPKIEGYVENIVPSLSAMEFKSHFRMLPETFEFVLGQIAERLQRTANGNEMISPEKQFLIALWRMATPDSYRSIHTRFGVGKATAIRAVRRVTQALCGLASIFIQWPTEEKIEEIKQGFSHVGAFPGTIGAIDGTHINIPAPKKNPEAYINRKGHYSIQAQVVCDHMRVFTHINVGNVGSVHDARVFR